MSSIPTDPPDPAPAHTGQSTKHWDEYWRYGFITSCGDTFSGNYEGGLARVWNDFFSSLPAGSTVLDIGTGNGAIAMIANRVSRRDIRDFRIHGIDAADIDPWAFVGAENPDLSGIVFHARTPVERSGLADGSVNAVCGQYALEYTALEAATSELGRICAPGARALFVMHHSDSVVLRTAAEELRLGRLVIESGFLRHARELLEKMQELHGASPETLRSDPGAEAHRESLNRAAATLMRSAATSPQPAIIQSALARVSGLIREQTAGTGPGPASIDDHERKLRAHLDRLEDLRAASVDDTKALQIISLLEGCGFRCGPIEDVFHQPGKLAGRLLRARYAD